MLWVDSEVDCLYVDDEEFDGGSGEACAGSCWACWELIWSLVFLGFDRKRGMEEE